MEKQKDRTDHKKDDRKDDKSLSDEDIYKNWLKKLEKVIPIISEIIDNQFKGYDKILNIIKEDGYLSTHNIKKIYKIIGNYQLPRYERKKLKKGDYSKKKWKKTHKHNHKEIIKRKKNYMFIKH